MRNFESLFLFKKNDYTFVSHTVFYLLLFHNYSAWYNAYMKVSLVEFCEKLY